MISKVHLALTRLTEWFSAMLLNDGKDARMCTKLDGKYSEGGNSHYS